MAVSLPRDVLKWVLSLDLSYPVKNAKRDFANGFLVAEILYRYFPSEIQMHSFSNVSSAERKRGNWNLLAKFLKKKEVIVEAQIINGVMNCEGDAVVQLLQTLRKSLQILTTTGCDSDSKRSDTLFSDQCKGASQACKQDYYPQQGQEACIGSPMQPVTYGGARILQQQHVTGNKPQCDVPPRSLPPQSLPSYAHLQQQQYQFINETDPDKLIRMLQQGYLNETDMTCNNSSQEYQPGFENDTSAWNDDSGLWSGHPGSNQRQNIVGTSHPHAGLHGLQAAHEVQDMHTHDALAYSRKPRPVDYQPYSVKDYASKFDPKKRQGYWELGKLGPDLESRELQEKREKSEKLKEMAKEIKQANWLAVANSKPKPKPAKEPSSRERAIEFAKKVPKPEVRSSPLSARSHQATATTERQLTALEELEMKHNMHQMEVNKIRNDMARLLP